MDGITQECLLNGVNVLRVPLTHIINASILAGKVPAHWKEAIVVPILKKGSATGVNNFRPVSCLIAASKVLEKDLCAKQLQKICTMQKRKSMNSAEIY